jgi:hypothetical protein
MMQSSIVRLREFTIQKAKFKNDERKSEAAIAPARRALIVHRSNWSAG